MILFTALAVFSLTTMAQDDLYFNPKDEPKAEEHPAPSVCSGHEDPWQGGCHRDIDEYNRRGRLTSHYEKIGTDSLGNDIIQFQAGDGIYPDYAVADTLDPGIQVYSDDDEDYACSRHMSRWDDWYGPYDLWYASRWGWSWPYRYGYYGWYDPWYADLYWGWGGYYGWYSPWYYGYGPYYGWGYGWSHPAWGGHYHGGITGTTNHGVPVRRGAAKSFGKSDARRTVAGNTSGTNRVSRFGNSTAQGTRSFGAQRRTTTSNTNTMTRSSMPSRSTSSFGGGSRSSFGGGGSFGGGSRGGGSFGGGSRGGGGSFGGRR